MQALAPFQAEAQPDAAQGPGRRAIVREEHALVLEAVAALPANQQEAFRLKFEHGLTYRDISRVMNMPLSTVNYTIAQALNAVRTRLRGTLDLPRANEKD